ncbi:type IV fimbrial biogenesis protein FimT [Variovorax sp. YR634]|jgi:type IV fimbrial biogenesis protein FimT|uniref:GspH/FimT family pseudopilin n=1 Tax=Variovorax TaxID=34072 RepID=UPI00089D987F|nr:MULTISPECIES: GspH/FimT family pseudopilin [Variovorax]MDQ0081934.1 type IV fimbrial biogenesis protein FimT [Variovorax boronicumulans]SDW83832.1 type IV fimbrial biogenesis protein FimT [Variovorax sp. YR634]
MKGHLRRTSGFTLIELMVTIVLLAILTMLAMPSFMTWINNNKVRTVSDSLQNGLRFAQSEALRRSRPMVFSLTNSSAPQTSLTAVANGSNWSINVSKSSLDANNVFVQAGVLTDVASGVQITGPAAICFNAMGRVVANTDTDVNGASCDTASVLQTYDVTLTPGADRPLRVLVALGGQIRMCDPARKLSDSPDGCP